MIWTLATDPTFSWAGATFVSGASLAASLLWFHDKSHKVHSQQQCLRDELAAYSREQLDAHGGVHSLCLAACRLVMQISGFSHAAVFVADANGGVHVEASVGLDDPTLKLMNRWCKEEATRLIHSQNLTITLRPYEEAGVMDIEKVRVCRLHILPIRDEQGLAVGALAVQLGEMQHIKGEDLPLRIFACRLGTLLRNCELEQHIKTHGYKAPRLVAVATKSTRPDASVALSTTEINPQNASLASNERHWLEDLWWRESLA